MTDLVDTSGKREKELAPVPALPNHAAAHTLLSELDDALQAGQTLTDDFVAWARAKIAEAKSHL